MLKRSAWPAKATVRLVLTRSIDWSSYRVSMTANKPDTDQKSTKNVINEPLKTLNLAPVVLFCWQRPAFDSSCQDLSIGHHIVQRLVELNRKWTGSTLKVVENNSRHRKIVCKLSKALQLMINGSKKNHWCSAFKSNNDSSSKLNDRNKELNVSSETKNEGTWLVQACRTS